MKATVLPAFLLIASIVAVSCEEYIPVNLSGPEKMLVVNALMSTGDTVHTVYAGISLHSETKRLDSGHLECWVNGSLSAMSDTLVRKNGTVYHNAFLFKADFEAGDEVVVVVEAGGMRAEAKTTAPGAPVLAAVDTVHMARTTSDGDVAETLGLGIHVKDRPVEKNYYMLQAWGRGGNSGQLLEMDNSMDPLLNSGLKVNYGEGPDFFSNGYNIFTDEGFEGKTHIFKVSVSKGWHNGVKVRLLALDRNTYEYINSVWFEESGFKASYLLADKPYPANVTGDGIGLVSVMTSCDYLID
jgi:hypothetical protein